LLRSRRRRQERQYPGRDRKNKGDKHPSGLILRSSNSHWNV
jgi:hypothetical protein